MRFIIYSRLNISSSQFTPDFVVDCDTIEEAIAKGIERLPACREVDAVALENADPVDAYELGYKVGKRDTMDAFAYLQGQR